MGATVLADNKQAERSMDREVFKNRHMIKVVIADDSAFLRQVLQEGLESSSKIQVVASAKNGKEAIAMVKTTKPDLLVLDCEMPVMNGLECLRRIMDECPLPVFMFSSLTFEGASVTIKALEYGAVDFVHKPAGGAHSLNEVLDTLINKIELIVAREKLRRMSGKERVSRPRIRSNVTELDVRPRSIDVIAIGSSTGGVQAIKEVIPRLGDEMPPIVWVQHMPPEFTKSLANRVDSLSKMHVKEAEDGDLVERGNCYLAPGGYQMRVVKSGAGLKVRVGGEEKVSGHCPSCDVLFDSVSELFSSNAVGVILTGMGGDGARGLKKMHENGAYVIGQDETSCAVYGMPRTAYEIGAVDVELDIGDIADGIKKVTGLLH